MIVPFSFFGGLSIPLDIRDAIDSKSVREFESAFDGDFYLISFDSDRFLSIRRLYFKSTCE